jgi:hypothetical protein
VLNLSLPGRVFMCTTPTEMLKSFDTLSDLLAESVGARWLSRDSSSLVASVRSAQSTAYTKIAWLLRPRRPRRCGHHKVLGLLAHAPYLRPPRLEHSALVRQPASVHEDQRESASLIATPAVRPPTQCRQRVGRAQCAMRARRSFPFDPGEFEIASISLARADFDEYA